eukprot:728003-Prorocentrum_minimum.AAC.2
MTRRISTTPPRCGRGGTGGGAPPPAAPPPWGRKTTTRVPRSTTTRVPRSTTTTASTAATAASRVRIYPHRKRGCCSLPAEKTCKPASRFPSQRGTIGFVNTLSSARLLRDS